MSGKDWLNSWVTNLKGNTCQRRPQVDVIVKNTKFAQFPVNASQQELYTVQQ